jgi:uncharacterized RDD family membrane protein YckC
MTEITYDFPKANPRHRLAGALLDIVFCWLTLGIGWFIWSLVVWGRGQTPGKQIVKLRVYDKSTGRPVRWGHMLIRQYLLLITPAMLLFVLFYVVGGIHYFSGYPGFAGWNFDHANTGFWFAGYGISSGAFGFKSYAFFLLMLCYLLPIVDAFWIFAGGRNNRLVDIIAKTDVLNEAAGNRVSTHASPSRSYVQNPYAPAIDESKVARKIREATELFQSGHISEAEYLALKKRIIENE